MTIFDGGWEPHNTTELTYCGAVVNLPYHFVSGPMSDIEAFNYPLFNEISGKLRDVGLNVFNPAPVRDDVAAAYNPQTEEELYKLTLRECMRWLLDPNCEAIVVLPNWRDSSGSRLETFAAWTVGLPLFSFSEHDGMVILTQEDWTYDETDRPTRAAKSGKGYSLRRDSKGSQNAGIEGVPEGLR